MRGAGPKGPALLIFPTLFYPGRLPYLPTMYACLSLRDWLVLAAIAAAVTGVAIAGSVVTIPAIPGWYAGLEKPWFTPPNGVFAPVWTVLYAVMAYAAWRAWRAADVVDRHIVLIVFAGQLALNALWSQLFFGWQRPDLAMVDIVLLWAAIATTLVVFGRFDRLAAGLMVPYFLWVSFAAVLNAAIIQLNA
jgi:translocator protein